LCDIEVNITESNIDGILSASKVSIEDMSSGQIGVNNNLAAEAFGEESRVYSQSISGNSKNCLCHIG